MCAMISGLFIGSNDGWPPQAYKENIFSLNEQNQLQASKQKLNVGKLQNPNSSLYTYINKTKCTLCTRIYNIISSLINKLYIFCHNKLQSNEQQKLHPCLKTVISSPLNDINDNDLHYSHIYYSKKVLHHLIFTKF